MIKNELAKLTQRSNINDNISLNISEEDLIAREKLMSNSIISTVKNNNNANANSSNVNSNANSSNVNSNANSSNANANNVNAELDNNSCNIA